MYLHSALFLYYRKFLLKKGGIYWLFRELMIIVCNKTVTFDLTENKELGGGLFTSQNIIKHCSTYI